MQMHKHGNHSAASQVHAAERAEKEKHAGSCGNTPLTHDAIAHRAYDIYVKTGSKQGNCKQNWQQAETELQVAEH